MALVTQALPSGYAAQPVTAAAQSAAARRPPSAPLGGVSAGGAPGVDPVAEAVYSAQIRAQDEPNRDGGGNRRPATPTTERPAAGRSTVFSPLLADPGLGQALLEQQSEALDPQAATPTDVRRGLASYRNALAATAG